MEEKIKSVTDETTKRLQELQSARDHLQGRAEAHSLQLREVQDRNSRQIEEVNKVVEETKQRLADAETEVCHNRVFMDLCV